MFRLHRFVRFLLASIIPTFALSVASPALAETDHDEQAWVNLTASGSVSGDLVYFAEVQPRFGNGARLDQLLLRGAVGWKLSPSVTLYQGYAHVVTAIDRGRDINEERSFQQLNVALGKPLGGELSSRTRLEQRWRSNGSGVGLRLREMVRYEHALARDSDAVNALVWSEAFVAFNDTDWGARSGFDQLRTFVGAELGLPGASTIEVGYLNQTINQTAGRTRMNHAASVTVWYRH